MGGGCSGLHVRIIFHVCILSGFKEIRGVGQQFKLFYQWFGTFLNMLKGFPRCKRSKSRSVCRQIFTFVLILGVTPTGVYQESQFRGRRCLCFLNMKKVLITSRFWILPPAPLPPGLPVLLLRFWEFGFWIFSCASFKVFFLFF